MEYPDYPDEIQFDPPLQTVANDIFNAGRKSAFEEIIQFLDKAEQKVMGLEPATTYDRTLIHGVLITIRDAVTSKLQENK